MQFLHFLEQGILLDSEAPRYLYTRLSETKVEILAEAARDARERAQQIAISNGATPGELRSGHISLVTQHLCAPSRKGRGTGLVIREASVIVILKCPSGPLARESS